MAEGQDDDLEAEALAWLAETLPPARPPAELRARLLRQLRGPARFAPFAAEIASAFGLPEPTVVQALARVDDEVAWLELPSLEPRILPVQGRVVISRLGPGLCIPHHRHTARELTYVLEGVLVSDGIEHRRGSLMDMAAGTEHALIVGGDHPCLVVFASLREPSDSD